MDGLEQLTAAEGEGSWVQTGSGEWVPGTKADYIFWLEENKKDNEDEIRQLKELLQEQRTALSLKTALMDQQKTAHQRLWRIFELGTQTMEQARSSGLLQFDL
jgi:hypothetical protein